MDDHSHSHRSTRTAPPPAPPEHFHKGDTVQVRSAVEILASLDMDGRLEGLAFLPEMVPLIGTRQIVGRRAGGFGLLGRKHSVCLEITRNPNDVVNKTPANILGNAHAGLMIWKEAWLTPVDSANTPLPQAEQAALHVLVALAKKNAH